MDDVVKDHVAVLNRIANLLHYEDCPCEDCVAVREAAARISALEEENKRLTKELLSEWLSNHWEHCGCDAPGAGRCAYPMSQSIRRARELVEEK